MVTLREPVSRAFSSYLYLRKHGQAAATFRDTTKTVTRAARGRPLRHPAAPLPALLRPRVAARRALRRSAGRPAGLPRRRHRLARCQPAAARARSSWRPSCRPARHAGCRSRWPPSTAPTGSARHDGARPGGRPQALGAGAADAVPAAGCRQARDGARGRRVHARAARTRRSRHWTANSASTCGGGGAGIEPTGTRSCHTGPGHRPGAAHTAWAPRLRQGERGDRWLADGAGLHPDRRAALRHHLAVPCADGPSAGDAADVPQGCQLLRLELPPRSPVVPGPLPGDRDRAAAGPGATGHRSPSRPAATTCTIRRRPNGSGTTCPR